MSFSEARNSLHLPKPNRDSEYWPIPVGTKAGAVPELVSRSLVMRRISQQLHQLNGARLILIEGEAGAGKQLLARHIRALQPTAGSLVVEEAASLFHGEQSLPATHSREVLAHAGQPAETPVKTMERCAQGFLVLRGIDELDEPQQIQLLRFIRSFETSIVLANPGAGPLPFQVICTSQQSLRARVLAGRFLPELYYRLSAACLAMPALHERKEDIPGLVRVFIEACSRERRRPLQGLGPGALSILLHHRWPGNVRELESVIRGAAFSTEGQWIRPIDLVILPIESVRRAAAEPSIPPDLNLDGVLRRHVQHVLKTCDGNKARAATQLGISRSTLYRMLEGANDLSRPIMEADSHPSEPQGFKTVNSTQDELPVS